MKDEGRRKVYRLTFIVQRKTVSCELTTDRTYDLTKMLVVPSLSRPLAPSPARPVVPSFTPLR